VFAARACRSAAAEENLGVCPIWCTPCIDALSVIVVSPEINLDRRAVLKSRHRAAIIDAAQQLVEERGGPNFTADELADRADVARRTIFNHFSSVDEVLLTLCSNALEVLIDDFVADVAAAPDGDGTRAALFEQIAQTMRKTDLPSAIATIARIIGEPDPDDPRGRALSEQAFARAAERLLPEVERRNPAFDRLDAQILVGSLMNGMIIIAGQWAEVTGVRLDAEGRASWNLLLDRLIENVRIGYQPAP
jgi:TetR/AcrR family transcriptional regulator of autoinduction and epiphytic fitness